MAFRFGASLWLWLWLLVSRLAFIFIFVASTGADDVIAHESDVPRPSLPMNALVQGWWYCGGVSPFCINQYIVGYQAMAQAWMKFNETDNFLQEYREDAVVNTTGFTYNREYMTRTQLDEYMLLTPATNNFTCVTFPGQSYFNRNLLQNATYSGITDFDGHQAYHFHGKWEIKDYTMPFQSFVDVNTEQILGWISMQYTWRYITVIPLEAIDDDIFVRPAGVQCSNYSGSHPHSNTYSLHL